jgi:hypothetical protein
MAVLLKNGQVVRDGIILGTIELDGAVFVGKSRTKRVTSFDLDEVLNWFNLV